MQPLLVFPRRTLPPALTLALLPALLGGLLLHRPARAESGTATAEEALLAAPEFAHGDYDGLARRILELVQRDPDAPLAEVALRQLATLRPALHHPGALLPALQELERSSFKNAWNLIWVRLLLADLLRESGRDEEADQANARIGILHRWLSAGPFGRTELASFDEPFPPETGDDSLPAGAWRPIPGAQPGRPIQAFEALWPREGAAYALAQLELPAAGEGHVLVQAPGSFKLWINGVPAAEVDRMRRLHPSETVVRVRFRAGWNRLLLKFVSGTGGLFLCRVLDADGSPCEGLRQADGIQLHPVARPTAPEAPPSLVRPGAFRAIAADADAARSPGPLSVALLALLHSYLGEEDDGLAEMKRAVALDPASPFLQTYLGQLYETADFLPESFRGNRARDAYARALAIAPAFLPAAERTALLEQRNEKSEQAIERLRKAVAAEPRYFRGRLYLAQLYEAQGWRREADAEFRKLDELYPGADAVLQARIGRARSDKLYVEAVRLLEAFAKDHASSRDDLLLLYPLVGRSDDALAGWKALLARAPHDLRVLARLVELHRARGEWDAALGMNQRRLELVPEEPRFARERGDLLLRAGRKDEALAAYAAALTRDPSQHSLRREVASLRGEEEDIEGPFAVDARTLLANSPTRRDFPKAAIVYLLDQAVVRIFEDGSSTEVVHQVYKILNDEGIDKYDKLRLQGELLEARTLTPDGRTVEPILLPGSRELTMPHLEIGSVIEHKYRRDTRRTVGNRFRYPTFFFQDFNFDGPFQRSRFIVETPRSFPFRFVERNMPVSAQVSEEGGRRIHVWDVRHSERLEEEPHQPSYGEFLPHVFIAGEESWVEVADQCRELLLGHLQVTRELREKAAELTAGKTSVRDRLGTLYAFVNSWVKDDQGGRTAQEILTERAGLRMLLVGALADAAGLNPEFVFARANRWIGPEPPWELPSLVHLTEIGAALTLLRVLDEDGAYVWVDPQNRYARLGEIPWPLQGGRGMVLRPGGPVFVRVPEQPAEEREEEQSLEVSVEPDGGARGRQLWTMRGEQALRTRPRLVTAAPDQRRTFFETLLNASFPGVKLTSLEFPGLETPGASLRVVEEFRLPRFAEVGRTGARCPIGTPPLDMQGTFGSEPQRRQPLQISRWFAGRTRASLLLPANWRVKDFPESVALETKFGSYSLLFSRDAAGKLHVERHCALPPQQIPPADYEAFLDLCRKIDAAERRKIQIDIGQ
ncbi:MAG: DUF3857 domain-containing protein [Planctomycetes bacterium]|nr:DUF3857 domain-containing protein [Planctomycetota bacterium]